MWWALFILRQAGLEDQDSLLAVFQADTACDCGASADCEVRC
jgi:hypothetical protein